ncbi:MAG TPA: hypothetical protein VIF43_04465 [Patescibacteria group bacterium]|jgi:hypothetical protein
MKGFKTSSFAAARDFSLAGFGLGGTLASGVGLTVSGRRSKDRGRTRLGIFLTTLSALGSAGLAFVVGLKGSQ